MKRLQQLDSLRGLAAITVVLTHFDALWINSGSLSLPWRTLHLVLMPLYSGHQAVMLFFVLSGFVLALPFEAGRPQPYPVFLLRRVTRIYGPYLVALLISVAGCAAFHGNLLRGPWIADTWAQAPSWSVVLQHIAFLDSFDPRPLNPPVWSLVHEMRISLVFPVLWLCSRRLGTGKSLILPALFTGAAVFLALWHGEAGLTSVAVTLHYAGFFLLGILLARHYARLLPSRRSRAMLLGTASALVYFYGAWVVEKLTSRLPGPVHMALAEWVTVIGAVGLILTAIASPGMLHTRFPMFAGRISYSLYLVHFTVLMIVAFNAHALTPWLQFPIYLAGSFVAATLFCRYVEEPFARWGRTLTKSSTAPESQAHLGSRSGPHPV